MVELGSRGEVTIERSEAGVGRGSEIVAEGRGRLLSHWRNEPQLMRVSIIRISG